MIASKDCPFSGQSLIYERRGDGYLLYSVFENGRDDGGSDFSRPIVGGQWTAGDEFSPPGLYESDLVIRVPQPRLELPRGRRGE